MNRSPENTIPKNIVTRMKALRLTQNELAEAAGLSQASVNLIISGKTKKSKFLPDIARALKCTVEELEGRYAPSLEVITTNAAGTDNDFASIPFYNVELSAGHGSVSEDGGAVRSYIIPQTHLDQLGVPASVAVVAKVRGESMEPDLFNGDTILINSIKTTLVSGKLYAFEFDGELKVKRFFKRLDNSWRIVSTNEDKNLYPDETLAPYNIGSLRIIGQVVSLLERRLD